MIRREVNLATGQTKEITLTPAEEAAALAQQAAWEADNTQDKRAARFIDSFERIQFERIFNLENRVRALEAKPAISAAAFRQELIDRWKVLNP